MIEEFGKVILAGFLFLLMVCVNSILLMLFTHYFWNEVMPGFGLHVISYWQAFCISFLAGLLFKS